MIGVLLAFQMHPRLKKFVPMTWSCCVAELITILNCIVTIQMAEEKPTFLTRALRAQCLLSTRNVDLFTTWMPGLDSVAYALCLARAVESSPPGLLLQDFCPGGVQCFAAYCCGSISRNLQKFQQF